MDGRRVMRSDRSTWFIFYIEGVAELLRAIEVLDPAQSTPFSHTLSMKARERQIQKSTQTHPQRTSTSRALRVRESSLALEVQAVPLCNACAYI